jgi:hypothetical protein
MNPEARRRELEEEWADTESDLRRDCPNREDFEAWRDRVIINSANRALIEMGDSDTVAKMNVLEEGERGGMGQPGIGSPEEAPGSSEFCGVA